MATLTPDTDLERLIRRYAGTDDPAALRSTPHRRRHLERYARLMSDEEVSLSLDPDADSTARVVMQGDTPRIDIPSWEIPQPVTDYQRRAYDMLMQRMLTLHEVGHVRYTDEAAVDTAVAQVDAGDREVFRQLWNALEDAAIEEQLRREFDVTDEFEVMNANYLEQGSRPESYGLLGATHLACLDTGVYDTGHLRRLLDPDDGDVVFSSPSARETFVDSVLPLVCDTVANVVADADPISRTERILDFWAELRAFLDDADPDDVDEALDDRKGDHAEGTGAGDPADRLDSISPDDVDSRSRQVLGGDTGPDDTPTGAGGSDTRSDDPDPSDTDTDGPSDGDADNDASDDGDASDSGMGDDAGDSDADGGASGDETGGSPPNAGDDRNAGDSGGAAGGQDGATTDGDVRGEGGDEAPDSGQGGRDAEAGDADDGPGEDAGGGGRDTDSGKQEGDATDAADPDSGSGPGPDTGSTAQDAGDDDGSLGDDGDRAPPTDRGGGGGAAPEAGFGSGEVVAGDIRGTPDQDPDIESEYLSLVGRETDELDDEREAVEADMAAFQDVLAELRESGDGPDRLEVVSGGETRDGWAEARSDGRQLRRILDRRLQQEQRSQWRRGRHRGRVDPRALPRVRTNDPRVFRQRDDPDEKDYATAIVLDRSGSMNSDIHHAERAAVALAYGLEELGIDTCVVDFRRGPRLAKPFGATVESCRDALLTGETGGGTPLAKTLRLVRERVRHRGGHPFGVVVTDGEPSNLDDYLEVLRTTRFPVLGVYLAPGARSAADVDEEVMESARLFDRRTIVTDPDLMLDDLRGLCREVMF